MTFQHDGHEYEAVIGSDLKRDGMFLEVRARPGVVELLEVFYSDQTEQMTFTGYQPDIPLEVVEWAASMARKRLIPTTNRADGDRD
ncbi:MAG: hypothetical protein AMXMBFR47_02650 [Planctomycetota bacterium]